MYDFILLQMVMPTMLLTFIAYPLPRRAYTYSEYIAIGMEFINAFDTMDMIGDLAFIRHYGAAWEVLFYISLGVTAISIAFPIKAESDKYICENKFAVSSYPSTVSMAILSESITSSSEAPIATNNDSTIQRAQHKAKNKLSNSSNNIRLNVVSPSESESSKKKVTPDDQWENKGAIKSPERKWNLKRCATINLSKTQKKIIKIVTTVLFTDTFFALLRFKIMVEENSAVHGFNMVMKNLILTCLHLLYLLQHIHSLLIMV